MIPIIHRVNNQENLETIPKDYGIEIDVRLNNNNLILSHEPSSFGENLSEYLKKYDHNLLVVNIKEDGIENDVIDILNNFGIERYFLLDIENSFLIQNHKNLGSNLSIRFSKLESISTVKNFKNTVSWLWIDTYEDFELNKEIAEIIQNFKTCLVSPSRWGYDIGYHHYMNKFKEFEIDIDYVMVEKNEIT